jgi:hypothetical protein
MGKGYLIAKQNLVPFAILFLVAGAIAIFYMRNPPVTMPMNDIALASKQSAKLSEYMNQHLDELSAAVVNGKKMRLLNLEHSDGAGRIEYTDGTFNHIADFTYAFEKDGSVVIKKFAIKS